jgi:hypothetical protein
VTLAEGEVRTTDLHDVASSCRVEAPAPEPERIPPASRSSEPRTEVPAPPPAEGEQATSPWKWAGLAIAGAGAVAVGVGGYLALSAKSDYDSVGADCQANICNQRGYDVRNSARSQADVATITMTVGGVAAVGGLLMWLLVPSADSGHASSSAGHPRLAIGPGSVALTVPLR